MTAKSGKMNLSSKIAITEPNKKITTQVNIVKRESARHLLRQNNWSCFIIVK